MQDCDSAEERWVAAVHEAGHAVAAVSLGYDLKNVVLENAYSCCAHLPLKDEPPGGVEAWTDREERYDGIYTLAGAEAEIELFGAATDLGDLDDNHFRTLGPRGDSHALEEWRASVKVQAMKLVSRHQESISEVARALLAKGRLSGLEVQRIFARHR